MKKPIPAAIFAVFLLVISAWVTPAYAQVLYGSITGRVEDATGAAIPGAEVTATNLETNYTTSVLTNETGTYLIRNVPVGAYNLRIALPGFQAYVAERVPVSVGETTRHNATLQVGEITEQMTVEAAATALQTDTSEVRTHLEDEAIENLPLNVYRNFQSLLNLVPGATPAAFQNAITDTPQRALTTNINGTARNNNNTRIDGSMSVNLWLPHHTRYVPPPTTIEEVNITTNSFDAEKGFAGGASVTVITKSGTNDLSGSIYGFHENSALNARDFFNFIDTDGDGDADKPAGRRTFAGFSVGGPIVHDKLFFYGAWDGLFQGLSRTDNLTLPTEAQRQGDFSGFDTIIYDPMTGNPDGTGRQPLPNNIIPADRLSPAAQEMQSLLPIPNIPDQLTNNFEISGQEVMNRHYRDLKIDWYRTDEHRLWGKWGWMSAEVEKQPRFGIAGGGAVGGGGDGVGDTDVLVYNIGHSWTLSPTFLIDGVFGFSDMDQEVITADLDLGNFGQEVLGIPGTNVAPGQERACIVEGLNRCGGVPEFVVSGFSPFGQIDGWSPLFRDEDSATFTHNFSWIRGNHELRWGYDMVRHDMVHWQPEIGPGPRGFFSFNRETTALQGGDAPIDQNAWAAFLLGLPFETGKSLQWELMTANEWQHAWYFRDRWQVTPALTLNLGLRYEYFPLVTRDDRDMEFLDLDAFNVVLANDIDVSTTMFAPRVGLAYRLTDDDVIRAGYGITNDPLPFARPLRGFFPLTVAGEFEGSTQFDPATSLEDGIPIFAGPETTPGAEIPLPPFVTMRTMPRNEINRGYIQSWNLVYERKLPAQFVASIGYVGTQTTNQLADHDINWSPAGGGTEGRQLFPLSTTSILFWDGWLSSNYHSLQASVNRRFINGLFVKGAYTYSRALNMTDDDGWAGVMWNDPDLIHRNYAQAGYNRPHILQLGTIYSLPFGEDQNTLMDRVVGGWQLNGIFSWHSGSPFTVGAPSGALNARGNAQTADQVNSDAAELGGIGVGDPFFDPTAFADPQRVPGVDCTNLDCYGTSGRNILRGPDWANLDLSLFRRFAFTEETNLEFRAEFLNVTNTPHFNNPATNVAAQNFMFITSTSDNAPERIIRFGLRLNF